MFDSFLCWPRRSRGTPELDATKGSVSHLSGLWERCPGASSLVETASGIRVGHPEHALAHCPAPSRTASTRESLQEFGDLPVVPAVQSSAPVWL